MSAETDNDDLVAAEYVLGTLDPEERAAAALRIEEEPAFASSVASWSDRLTPLSEGDKASTTVRDLWPSLVRRLGWTEALPSATILALERRVRRWRVAATAATAIAASLAVVAALTFQRAADTPRSLIAVLQPSDAAPAYLIRADLSDRRLAVRPVAAKPPAGKVFQLWIVDPSLGDPRSLGVLGEDGGLATLPPGIAADVAARATYAISVEPPGGSPSGKPSGAPVFVGHLAVT